MKQRLFASLRRRFVTRQEFDAALAIVKHDVSLYTDHVEECERRLGRLEAKVALIDERADVASRRVGRLEKAVALIDERVTTLEMLIS